MNVIFGPVNSRRFGLSLGVDLSPARKQCNFDCVYCELKLAKPVLLSQNAPSVDEVVSQVQNAFDKGLEFDFITLTANGEPSLYPHLKELVKSLNAIKKEKKLLILSNGTGVLDECAFEAMLGLDVAKFSLDSAVERIFFRVDRAHKSINLQKMIEKMAEFRAKFRAQLVMEVLVVQGLNDNELEFKALNEAFLRIKPDRVDIGTIDRPSAYPVRAVSEQTLEKLSKFITSAPVLLPKRHCSVKSVDFSEDELLKILALRPQSELDIKAMSQNSKALLQKMLESSKIRVVELAGVKFYRV